MRQVSLADLEVIRAVLNSCHHQNMTMDLSDQYRKLSNRQQYSPLTKSIEGALALVDARLEAEPEEADAE